MKLKDLFKKYKIRAKKLYTVILLTIIEIIGIIWFNDWVITPAILVPLVQFVAIFENRDVWKKLTEKEKTEITLTKDELDSFVTVIVEKLDYMSLSDILEELNFKEE